ncbi:FHA domain-containing protein [Mucilaginibacter lacusdianchii]|uniref:FHA domain-containing protein n=1 Tax=Mucilaginibacter lacusdianchii TaxID=2684211 RepID=UPI00131B9870|nr:FHA domain-containing protein [Mucilaginibacter sp. JXJ CY 39]
MVFNLFKSDTDERPDDVKGVRQALLRFIKDVLQKAEGGEGAHIKGLCLFMACNEDDKHVYEAAVYLEEQEQFKNEIQRIADDYAIGLPPNWTLEFIFGEDYPTEAIKASNLDAALFIKTNKHFIQQKASAYIRVLSGEAEKNEYAITSDTGKLNIGRDRKAQVDDGFFRTNHIAFPSTSANDANRYISRQHAHVEWSNDAACFMLFADDGGVPPRNKIKIRSVDSEELIKLHSTHIGHHLKEGDQIVLGESAVIEFSYKPEED